MKTGKTELLATLRNVTIFSGINDATLRHIIDDCGVAEYKAGDMILHEGSPATDIFVVLSGTVKTMVAFDTDPFETGRFGAGNCIGEAAVIGIQCHRVSVVAVSDVTLLTLSRKMLIEIQIADKELFSLLILNIARELARRLTEANEWIRTLSKSR